MQILSRFVGERNLNRAKLKHGTRFCSGELQSVPRHTFALVYAARSAQSPVSSAGRRACFLLYYYEEEEVIS
jgi:hypothetical protein